MKRSRTWVPVLLGVLAFLLTTVTLGALVADWTLRNQEMDALVTAVEQSEAQMTWTQDGVGLIFDGLEDPSQVTENSQLTLELQGIAAEGRDRIKAAGDQVAAVRVSPWHQDVLLAKQAYLQHNLAWQSYLDRAAKDALEFTLPQDEVNSTFMEAEPLFRAAIPDPAGFSLDARVGLIFAEPESESGPTQEARTAV